MSAEYSVEEAIAAADWISHMRTPYKGILEDAARAYAEHLSTHPRSPGAADSGRVDGALWERGDDYTPEEAHRDMFTAGIHVGKHDNAVECYADTAEVAASIRDRILAALAAQGQGELIADSICNARYWLHTNPDDENDAAIRLVLGAHTHNITGIDCYLHREDYAVSAPAASPARVPDADFFWNPYTLRGAHISIESALQAATEAGAEGVLTIWCAARLPGMTVTPIIDQNGTVTGYKAAPSATPEGGEVGL